MVGSSPYEDGDGLGVLASGDEGHLLVADEPELDAVGCSEVVGAEFADLADDVGVAGFGEPLHIALLHAAAGVDAFPGEEVLCEVVDSLLAEDDVGSGLLACVDHGLEGVLLFLDELGEHLGVGDLDLCVHLGLLDLEGSVDECDLGTLDYLGHGGGDGLLVDDETFDELGLFHVGSGLLDGADVLQVGEVLALVVLLDDGLDSVDDHLGEEVLGGVDLLAVHGDLGDLQEEILVFEGDLLGDLFENLLSLLVGKPVSSGDDGGVDVGVDQVEGFLEELSCDDDGGGGTVSDLVVLCLGDLDEHLCCGVLYIHLLQDGDTVVGDDDVSEGVDEHLVHSPGAEAAPYGVSDGPGGSDVVELRVFSFFSFASFSEDKYRCVTHSHCVILLWYRLSRLMRSYYLSFYINICKVHNCKLQTSWMGYSVYLAQSIFGIFCNIFTYSLNGYFCRIIILIVK